MVYLSNYHREHITYFAEFAIQLLGSHSVRVFTAIQDINTRF